MDHSKQQLNLLIVGAGGLGCQLLKNLIKMPNKLKITIADYDTVSETNLNRQFCFRVEDIGQSKVQTLKKYFDRLKNSCIEIEIIEENIMELDLVFFWENRFDMVVSALDNAEARNYLNKMSIMVGITMIDAGTAGFNGQGQGYTRFLSQCRFCRQDEPHKQSYAVCTIRNKPQKNIHCIHFALNIFQQISSTTNRTDSQLQKIVSNYRDKINKNQKHKLELLLIHNYLFSEGLPNIPGIDKIQRNNLAENILKIDQESLYERLTQQWGQQELSETFIHVLKLILEGKTQQYDKDNFIHALFIFCLTNLRILNFINTENTQLKLLTFYECKDLSGKIIPALASTNSIAAAIQIISLMKIVKKSAEIADYTLIRCSDPEEKVYCLKPYLPAPQCSICSPENFYLILSTDFLKTTFEELQNFLTKAIDPSFTSRDLKIDKFTIIRNSTSKPWHVNKPKVLNFNEKLLKKGYSGTKFLTIQYHKTEKFKKYFQIVVIHRQIQESSLEILLKPNYEKQEKLILEYQSKRSKEQQERYDEEEDECFMEVIGEEDI